MDTVTRCDLTVPESVLFHDGETVWGFAARMVDDHGLGEDRVVVDVTFGTDGPLDVSAFGDGVLSRRVRGVGWWTVTYDCHQPDDSDGSVQVNRSKQ